MKKYLCRHCGEEVIERPVDPEVGRSWDRAWWSHKRDEGTSGRTAWEDEHKACADGKTAALPREVCYWMKGDGNNCTKVVKQEDLDSGIYACGTHTPKFIEEKEILEARRKRAEQEEQSRAIAVWENQIYQAAYDRLTAMSDELFPPARRPKTLSPYDKRFRDLTVEVDIVALAEWMEREQADIGG